MEGYLKKRKKRLQNSRHFREVYEFLIPITVDPIYRAIYSDKLRYKIDDLYNEVASHWHGKSTR